MAMAKIITIAVTHFIVTTVSILVYIEAQGAYPVLAAILKPVGRILSLPGRKIGHMLLPSDSLWQWSFLAANSVLWAFVLVRIWQVAAKRRAKTA